MPVTNKVAQRSLWHEVSGVPGTWAQASGAALTTAATKTRDGGAPNTETLTGQPEYGDLTLTRPYDRARDVQAERALDTLTRRAQEVIVTRFLADGDGVILETDTWVGRVIGYTPPDTDAMSGNPATLSMVVSIDRRA